MFLRKINLLLATVFLIGAPTVFSQNIPPEKITEWSKAGLQSAMPVFDSINVLDNGLFSDGSTSNNNALSALMNAQAGTPTVFFFPAGEYLFNETISLHSQHVIKGASASETTFSFQLNGTGHAFEAKGNLTSTAVGINADTPADLNVVYVENAADFMVGDYIRIQFDDAQLVTSDWAEKSTGQIVQITGKDGNMLTTSNLIRRAIAVSENPYIEKINPIAFTGIECLQIERMDATSAQTSNVYFQFAANCWVKGVGSRNTNFAHVDLENCIHVHVTGSHFKDAFDYGNGGRGYGVVLEYNTSDCLIDNNIFDHLRHAMLLQAGANGNVLSYNYSIDPFWEEVGLPEDSAGDLVLHGNYPYLNLLEGNVVQNIVIDDSHGINGPGNMFYRNRAEHYGIFMNDDIPTDGQSFIGNEVSSTTFLLGFYDLAGVDHFEYGNNIKGNITPAGTGSISAHSLYLDSLPDYMKVLEVTLPLIGPPNFINKHKIPAQLRFEENELTQCSITEEEPVIIDFLREVKQQLALKVYPNPATRQVVIDADLSFGDFQLTISNMDGQLVYQADQANKVVDLPFLSNGLYLLTLENKTSVYSAKLKVVQP